MSYQMNIIHVLLSGSNVYKKMCTKLILDETRKFIKKPERFDTLEAFQIL